MKKPILLLVAILFANSSFSQFLTAGTVTTDNKYRSGGIGVGYTALPTFGTNKFMVSGNSSFSGNVGVGTTAPTEKLEISTGNLAINSGKILIGTTALENEIFNWGIKSDKPIIVSSALYPLVRVRLPGYGNGDFAVAPGDYHFSNFSKKGDVVIRGESAGSFIISNESDGDIKFVTGKFNLNTKVQMLIDKVGNIGIGTTTPTAKLDVRGQIKGNQGVFSSNQVNGTVYGTDINEKCNVLSAGSIIGPGAGYVNGRMLNFIDFPSPTAGSNTGSTFWFGIEDRNDFGRYRMTATTGGATYMGVLNKSQEDVFAVNEDGSDNVKVTMPKADSFLGIGTTSFTDATGTYKLAVAGNIRAHRVRVYTTWADFVFANDYKLPTLTEVENHIKENGHLKDIPSAKEVESDGIELGEMNKRLLQKVEELTLYVIQLNKELQDVKTQIKK